MSSLRDQLKKLATPATEQFHVDIRKKKSLIHTAEDAARIDLVTHYNTAKKAFEHLVNFDQSLMKFEKRLFSEASIQYEPSIQDLETKAKMESYIQNFLIKISPFLEVPKIPLEVLEWLVQRFQVHLYQPDDFIRCVLPYHDRPLFPKFVQLIQLDAHANRRWAWLKPIADNGVPLAKDELILICSRDMDVLLFLCRTLELSLKAMKRSQNNCRPIITLFTQVSLGLINQHSLAEEALGRVLAHLMHSVDSGLSSSRHPDYRAAAYLLVAAIIKRTQVAEPIVMKWIGLILSNPPERNPQSALMLVSLLAHRHDIDCLDIEMAESVLEIFNSLPADTNKRNLVRLIGKFINTADPSLADETTPEESMEVDQLEESIPEEIPTNGDGDDVPSNDPDEEERTLLKEAKERQKDGDLAKWLILTAVAGSTRPKSVVPEIFALEEMKEHLGDVAWTRKNKKVMGMVLVHLLLLLQHDSPKVRGAVMSCLHAIKRLLKAAAKADDETGIPESRALRKLLKIKDRRLVVEDRTFLQQPPYNALIVKEFAEQVPADQVFPSPPDADAELHDRNLWRNRTTLLWRCLNREALSAAMEQCPPLSDRLVSLLQNLKPNTPEGDLIWNLWKGDWFEALPADARPPVLDSWLLTAATAKESRSAKVFDNLKIPVSDLKRLVVGLLPKKMGTSAKEMILRKRSRRSKSDVTAEEILKANRPRFVCLFNHMQQRDWTAKSDASSWTLVLPLLECLQIIINSSSTSADDHLDLTPEKKMKNHRGEKEKLPQSGVDKGSEASDESSDDESEIIAEYESGTLHLDVTMIEIVRGVLGTLLSLLKALPDSGATSDVALESLLDCLCRGYDRQVRQTALLVVSEMARLRPALLLRNMLPLLTFMRSHVFPLDDAYTLEVIGRVLDFVIPAYIRAGTATHSSPQIATVKVLEVLVDSFQHVPPHRRLPLFTQLGRSILVANTGLPACLWTLVALLTDRFTRVAGKADQHLTVPGVGHRSRRRSRSNSIGSDSPVMAVVNEKKEAGRKRLAPDECKFLCQLLSEFPVLLQLQTCADLLNFSRAYLVVGMSDPKSTRPGSPESPRQRRRSRSRNSLSSSGSIDGDDGVGLTLLSSENADMSVAFSLLIDSVGKGPFSDGFVFIQSLCNILSTHLASPGFLSSFVNTPAVPGHSGEVTGAVEALLQAVLQIALLTANQLQTIGKEDHTRMVAWRSLLHIIYQILEEVHAFLPVSQHLAVVLRLCSHSLPAVRRKSLEVLHGRLAALPGAAGPGPHAMTALVPLLLRAVAAVEECATAEATGRELSLVRQTALVCAKELARLLAADHRDRFLQLLERVGERVFHPEEVDIDAKTLSSGEHALDEEACGYVLLAELLRQQPHAATASFARLLDRLLAQLVAHRSVRAAGQQGALHRQACLALLVAAAAAPARHLGRPGLLALVRGLVRLEAETGGDAPSLARLRTARKSLAEHAAPRTLLTCVGEVLRAIVKRRQWHWSPPLMHLWERHVNKLSDEGFEELVADKQSLIYKLCVNALAIRQRMAVADDETPSSREVDVSACEEASALAIMACFRKLSASCRDDLMEMLFDWTRMNQSSLHRQVAFFRLCDCLASRIPDCLVAACTHLELFEFASSVLTQLRSQEVEPTQAVAMEQDLLLRSLLSTLAAFFTDDSKDTPASLAANAAMQTLIPAIVSALEVMVGGVECYRQRCDLFLLPCLVALAEASGADETILQPLCHQVCLRMKSPDWTVRIYSLRTTMGFVEKLEDVFNTSLLQDCLPYLAECLEDDRSEVQELAYEVCEKIRRTSGGELDF